MSKSKPQKLPKPGSRNQQYAALPFRLAERGIEVLLLTSRGTGRWVIPKGWPMRKLTPAGAAVREAYEEAGLEGTIQPGGPVGSYRYAKRLVPGELPIHVAVFLLRVERQLDQWPEQAERETRWFSPEEAASLVAEPELAAILLGLRALVGRVAV
jgi:8-oxo-dGTP pyrophosphatase MutT (NUDIX family)